MIKNEIMNLKNYKEYLLNEKMSENTINSYMFDLMQFVRFLNEQEVLFDNVTNSVLDKYYEYLVKSNNSNNTIYRKFVGIRKYYNFIKSINVANTIPITTYNLKSSRNEKLSYLTDTDYDKLIRSIEMVDFFGIRNACIIGILYNTGIKNSELIELTLDDVSSDLDVIYVSGKHERFIHLDEKVKPILKRYLAVRNKCENQSNCLFINNRFEKLTRQSIWVIIQKTVQKAGLSSKITSNSFRQTYVLNLFSGYCSDKNDFSSTGYKNFKNTVNAYKALVLKN